MRSRFFRRRELWLPTAWGWLLLILVAAAAAWLAARHIYGFLALNRPVNARVLVVEGWVNARTLEAAAATFRSRGYERLVTTGGPIDQWPGYSGPATYAERAADYLRLQGVPEAALTPVPAPASAQDRTFLSAVMVREWAKQSATPLRALDVFSEGTHARRSRLLYRLAFGPGTQVGVYSADSGDYDPLRWWSTSYGARDVLDQAIGLLWVKCFFAPPPRGSPAERWSALHPRQPPAR